MKSFIVSLALTALTSCVLATNYCSKTLCSSGVQHIACGHSGNFSGTCSSDATKVEVDDKLKSIIINNYNAKRNLIAGGGEVKHDPACRMATIQWDNELAALAALNVKQCAMAHDKCRNTDTFKYSGQNLAWIGYYGEPNTRQLLEQALNMWYNEVEYSNMTYIRSYPSKYQGPTIGHFTVMMADRNIRTGCAVATYSKPNVSYKFFLVACNYATTNMINFPIYASCDKAGSSCTTGTNPHYPNLCSTSEVYNVNKWY